MIQPRYPLLLGMLSFMPPVFGDGFFSVAGREILRDGEPFEVRGVCYQPTAIGENPISPDFYYGDFYHTDANSTGIDEQFPERWDRDFANFGRMGLNVLRIYQWSPGLDHSAFMAKAASHGIHIFVNRYIDPNADFADASPEPGYQPSADVLAYESEWRAIAAEIAGHPGVIGLLIGNETNWHTPTPAAFFQAMNYLAGVVKGIAPGKLVSTAITDRLDQVAAFDASVPNFDFWAIQVYRGNSFGSLLPDYAGLTGKPLVITEFGYDALDGRTNTEWPDDAALPASAIENLLNELRVDEAGADIASGVCVFEYADEWWKDSTGSPDIQEFGPGWEGNFLDRQGNEEWWGIFRIVDDGGNIDILQGRALYYRLAAMWTDPFQAFIKTSAIQQNLEMAFFYPIHLRDQRLSVEASPDLRTWIPVADNRNTTYLNAYHPTLSVTNIVEGEEVQVRMIHDPSRAGALNRLFNGGFELGDTSGWTSFASATQAAAKDGNWSLNLSAGGGYSVPGAYQTIPAAPGDRFNLSGWMFAPEGLPSDSTFGVFKIVFEDAMGNDLQPASIAIGTAGPGEFPGAESQPTLTANSPAATWIYSAAEAVAPEGTASVSFFILNVDESPAVMYFDDIRAIDPDAPPSLSGSTLFFRLNNAGR